MALQMYVHSINAFFFSVWYYIHPYFMVQIHLKGVVLVAHLDIPTPCESESVH